MPIHLDADRKCTKEFVGQHLAAGPGLAIDSRAVYNTTEISTAIEAAQAEKDKPFVIICNITLREWL